MLKVSIKPAQDFKPMKLYHWSVSYMTYLWKRYSNLLPATHACNKFSNMNQISQHTVMKDMATQMVSDLTVNITYPIVNTIYPIMIVATLLCITTAHTHNQASSFYQRMLPCTAQTKLLCIFVSFPAAEVISGHLQLPKYFHAC